MTQWVNTTIAYIGYMYGSVNYHNNIDQYSDLAFAFAIAIFLRYNARMRDTIPKEGSCGSQALSINNFVTLTSYLAVIFYREVKL